MVAMHYTGMLCIFDIIPNFDAFAALSGQTRSGQTRKWLAKELFANFQQVVSVEIELV